MKHLFSFFGLFNSGIKADNDSRDADDSVVPIRNRLQGLVDKINHFKRRMSGLTEEIVTKPGRRIQTFQSTHFIKNYLFHYFGIILSSSTGFLNYTAEFKLKQTLHF